MSVFWTEAFMAIDGVGDAMNNAPVWMMALTTAAIGCLSAFDAFRRRKRDQDDEQKRKQRQTEWEDERKRRQIEDEDRRQREFAQKDSLAAQLATLQAQLSEAIKNQEKLRMTAHENANQMQRMAQENYDLREQMLRMQSRLDEANTRNSELLGKMDAFAVRAKADTKKVIAAVQDAAGLPPKNADDTNSDLPIQKG
jgi:chromosome segregation ATPase